MTRFAEEPYRFSAVVAASFAIAALAMSSGIRAESPKEVIVINDPTVNAKQSGPWSVSLLGNLSLAPGNLVGIDPTKNLVTIAPPQPFQVTGSLSYGTSADTGQWALTVPAGKLLIIEYVSGSFTKTIGSVDDPDRPPFIFTVTTSAGGQTVAHVVPIRGIYDYATTKSWFQIAAPVRLYANGGTNVTVTLHHLFSPGYTVVGSASVAGQLQDAP
jgi:hypothetical protein